jgi:hypothetical protein
VASCVPFKAICHLATGNAVSTFEGMHRPWSTLNPFIADLRIEFLLFRWIYLASGATPGSDV